MKTIGLLGGMSWESTVPYYSIINEAVRDRLGGLHSAKILLYSVEFAEIEKHMSADEWEKCAEILGTAAKGLEAAGADFILICGNTMHKVAPQIASMISVPVVHIADAAADELEKSGVGCVGLLGTKYTMTKDFYQQRLIDRGIRVVVPDGEDVETVNSVIFDELCVGEIREESREKYREIIGKLREKGAEAILFGCTEIGLLIGQDDTDLPVFDTTVIHAKKAAELALEG